jgi:2,3-bisphosphoglycerate-independent phosphoglycerate mutase
MAERSSGEKYVILVGDGMADYPIAELDGKTPLEVARTPHMDRIAAVHIGLAKTIPRGMEPGSDVANLSLLGYDPAIYHTGRGPLEAQSMGISLQPHQVAFRMNLVTLERRSDQEIIMISHSSGDISSDEARPMVDMLKKRFDESDMTICPGVAYRHLLLWDNGPLRVDTVPPHDVLGRNMAAYLRELGHRRIQKLTRSSWEILGQHPVNIERRKKGLKEANSIWLWGQGKAPNLPSFKERFGLRGGVISAVDLLKGIGIYAGLEPIPVVGATGYLNTNFRGKAEETIKALRRLDFMFVHVEAPDEASHNGSLQDKIKAIEAFDEKVVGEVLAGLDEFTQYRIMVVSDHLTPLSKRTHTEDPTPFAWAERSALGLNRIGTGFNEPSARESGLFLEHGHEIISSFLR